MSRPVAPIVCDGPGCAKQKQETNRWWTVQLVTVPVGEAFKVQLSRIVILPGTSIDADDRTYPLYDFCGETCLLKWVSEQMSKVTS